MFDNLQFAPGSGPCTQMPFDIQINDDNRVEGQETFILEASVDAPGPGDFPANLEQATVVIIDDDRTFLQLMFVILIAKYTAYNVHVQ